jgi:hypothetical protein
MEQSVYNVFTRLYQRSLLLIKFRAKRKSYEHNVLKCQLIGMRKIFKTRTHQGKQYFLFFLVLPQLNSGSCMLRVPLVKFGIMALHMYLHHSPYATSFSSYRLYEPSLTKILCLPFSYIICNMA